jgi:hypothetical protein
VLCWSLLFNYCLDTILLNFSLVVTMDNFELVCMQQNRDKQLWSEWMWLVGVSAEMRRLSVAKYSKLNLASCLRCHAVDQNFCSSTNALVMLQCIQKLRIRLEIGYADELGLISWPVCGRRSGACKRLRTSMQPSLIILNLLGLSIAPKVFTCTWSATNQSIKCIRHWQILTWYTMFDYIPNVKAANERCTHGWAPEARLLAYGCSAFVSRAGQKPIHTVWVSLWLEVVPGWWYPHWPDTY